MRFKLLLIGLMLAPLYISEVQAAPSAETIWNMTGVWTDGYNTYVLVAVKKPGEEQGKIFGFLIFYGTHIPLYRISGWYISNYFEFAADFIPPPHPCCVEWVLFRGIQVNNRTAEVDWVDSLGRMGTCTLIRIFPRASL